MKNSATTKNSSKYTEDWLPIKSIANGAIILDNKQKVTGIKIKPRNIFILDQGTQDNTIIALKNFYNNPRSASRYDVFQEPPYPAHAAVNQG